MKKYIAILTFVLGLAITGKSQSYVTSWPSGSMTVSSATATTKVPSYTITPTQTAYFLNLAVDTSLVIKIATTYRPKAGSILYVNVTNSATGATRTITGSTNCTMAAYTMTSAKTHLLQFIYDGTNYINTGVIKVN